MTTQLPLFKSRAASELEKDRVSVVAYLRGKGWKSCRTIQGALGFKSDRTVREIAESSRGAIISGQQGYRLTAEATGEEIYHASHWLRSQARKMMERSIEIEQAGHRRIAA